MGSSWVIATAEKGAKVRRELQNRKYLFYTQAFLASIRFQSNRADSFRTIEENAGEWIVNTAFLPPFLPRFCLNQ
jgi:hypothetical protein